MVIYYNTKLFCYKTTVWLFVRIC